MRCRTPGRWSSAMGSGATSGRLPRSSPGHGLTRPSEIPPLRTAPPTDLHGSPLASPSAQPFSRAQATLDALQGAPAPPGSLRLAPDPAAHARFRPSRPQLHHAPPRRGDGGDRDGGRHDRDRRCPAIPCAPAGPRTRGLRRRPRPGSPRGGCRVRVSRQHGSRLAPRSPRSSGTRRGVGSSRPRRRRSAQGCLPLTGGIRALLTERRSRTPTRRSAARKHRSDSTQLPSSSRCRPHRGPR